MVPKLRTSPLRSPGKGLLGKQLANISETLSQASKRRDLEIHKRLSQSPSPVASATSTPVLRASSSPEAFVINETTNAAGIAPNDHDQIANAAQAGRIVKTDLNDIEIPFPSLRGGESVNWGDNDPKEMMASLERDSQSLKRSTADTCDNDLDTLRANIATMLSPSRKNRSVGVNAEASPEAQGFETESTLGETNPAREETGDLLKLRVESTIAPQLESVGVDWEILAGWTTYLFSDGVRGYKEYDKKKKRIIQKAAMGLEEVIERTLKEEEMYKAVEEDARLPCRVIVTNIAADADEEEVLLCFNDYKFEIREFNFLEEREPVKGTRVAHIDMWSRESAKQASRMMAHVYGLLFHVRLALEDVD